MLERQFVAELGERVRERMPGRQLRRAVGAEHKHGRFFRPREVVHEQAQRRSVGPMEIVEHQQHRPQRSCRIEQSAHRLEQPLARTPRRRGAARHVSRQVRHQRSELCCVDIGRRDAGCDSLLDGFGEWLIGDERVSLCPPIQDYRAGLVQPLGELGHEPRLPDPRLAGDESKPALPLPSELPLRPQTTQRGNAAHERRATVPRPKTRGKQPRAGRPRRRRPPRR